MISPAVREERKCACGCGDAVVPPREYVEGHRQRAYRQRVKARARALGVPVAATVRTLEALGTTRGRNGDAEIDRKRALTGKSKPSGRQVSARKMVTVLHDSYGMGWYEAAKAVDEALPVRQKLWPEQDQRQAQAQEAA